MNVDTVFPVLRSWSAGDAVPAGVAAGYDWAEAVEAGLVSRCRELTIAELAAAGETGDHPGGRTAAGRVLSEVDLAHLSLDEVSQRYRRMVALFGEPLAVYQVTGSLGSAPFAFCLGGHTVC